MERVEELVICSRVVIVIVIAIVIGEVIMTSRKRGLVFGLFGGSDIFDKVYRGLLLHVARFELCRTVINSHFSLL